MSIRGGIRDDETRGFDRPSRRTRPRTKDRPDYSDAEVGIVLTVDRGRYHLDVDGRSVVAAKARALGRGGVIVGDRVRVVGNTTGEIGSMARIVDVLQRTTVLRRTADDDDPYERPIVANADQILIVTALADPPPRPGMIDRILVAAYDAGISPVLCLTKADLAAPDELIELYSPLDLPIVVSDPEADLEPIRLILADHRTVLLGHSGVGKSTLVNLLIPGLDRAVGEVNEATGRGRHTSTSAVALRLPSPGGIVIDTPGVRSFGLSHVTPDAFLAAFSDLAPFTSACPRGCDHSSAAPECGLDQAAQDGLVPGERLESFRRLERAFTTPAS